jgi:hypothetical protein
MDEKHSHAWLACCVLLLCEQRSSRHAALSYSPLGEALL